MAIIHTCDIAAEQFAKRVIEAMKNPEETRRWMEAQIKEAELRIGGKIHWTPSTSTK